MSTTPKYVLISAAKDEGDFVGQMLESVAKQTMKPLRHIIVDDGSADATAQIIRHYEKREHFITLKRKPETSGRSFGSKATALRYAYDNVKGIEFDYVGCLDADITLPEDYYEKIIGKMAANPKLGIASGICLQKSESGWTRTISNYQHVPGAMQFFARACYDAIDGYQNVTVAGVDSLVEIKARMLGWQTRKFEDIQGYHHKPIGSATGGRIKTAYRHGMTDYLLGKHPLYVLLKGIRRLVAPPYGLSAIAMLGGYWWLLLGRRSMDVTDDVQKYVRAEELQAIKNAFLLRKKPY